MPRDQGGETKGENLGGGGTGGQIAARPKVVVLGIAKREGRKFLSLGQYLHAVDLVKRLVDFNDSQEMSDMRIEPIENCFELKDKGGLLGKINLRIYFGHYTDSNEIVVVKTYKKEENGKTQRHIVLTVQSRLRSYRKGELREGMTIYEVDTDVGNQQGC